MEIIDIGVMQELHNQHQFAYWRFGYLAKRIAQVATLIAESLPLLPPHTIANLPIEMIPLAEAIYAPTIPIATATLEQTTQVETHENTTQTLLQTIRGGFNRVYNIIFPPQVHPEEVPLPEIENELPLITNTLAPNNVDPAHTMAMIGGCDGWFH